MTTLNVKFAVAQFEDTNEADYTELIKLVNTTGGHWYYFERQNKEQEIEDLKQHYDIVLEVK